MAWIRIDPQLDALEPEAVLQRNYTLVSLTGSVHSSTVKGTRWDPDLLPMAWWIVERQPAFIIGIDQGAGTAWVSTNEGCKAQTIGEGKRYDEAAQIDAVVRIAAPTASPPASTVLDPQDD